MSGKLYIVSTPIGNLDDFSFRAIETLKNIDLIAAEDTRHSGKLLHHYNIKTPMISLHEHNEEMRVNKILTEIKNEKSVALISDAGTPLISDPGYRLVSEARKNNIDVIPIPGACAAIAALSISGLPSDKFIFEGFLPQKTGARKKRLEELKTESRTLIFYESPYRVFEMLKECKEIFGGERQAVVARELTKMFETSKKESLENLIDWLEKNSAELTGEFVIVISGLEKKNNMELNEEDQRILNLLLSKLSTKDAAELTHAITGAAKNVLYTWALDH
jgi:16S rRNA (cytidine1402-2'-O)-methyltransferase